MYDITLVNQEENLAFESCGIVVTMTQTTLLFRKLIRGTIAADAVRFDTLDEFNVPSNLGIKELYLNDDNFIVEPLVSVDLATLKKRHIAFYNNISLEVLGNSFKSRPYTRLIVAELSRFKDIDFREMPNLLPFASVMFNKPGSELFVDHIVTLYKPKAMFYHTNFEYVERSFTDMVSYVWEHKPVIKLHDVTAIPDGFQVAVDVTFLDGQLPPSCELYLESIVGLLPKTRVEVVDGVGKFKVLTTGLDSTDVIRTKVGFLNYGGLLDVEIPNS